MSDEIKQWYHALYKGRIANHVARGEDRPERIAVAIETSITKGKLDAAAVQRMLDEVHDEAIRPFLNAARDHRERLERFREIKNYLQTTNSQRRAE